MTKTEASVEGFVAVLKGMPKAQRRAVIARIASDKEFAEDIIDLATITARQDEPSRAFRDYLREKRAR